MQLILCKNVNIDLTQSRKILKKKIGGLGERKKPPDKCENQDLKRGWLALQVLSCNQ